LFVLVWVFDLILVIRDKFHVVSFYEKGDVHFVDNLKSKDVPA